MKVYIRNENHLIKSKLIAKVNGIESKVDARSNSIEEVVQDLSNKLNDVNNNIEDKLDAMGKQFEEIKQMIEVIANPSDSGSDGNNMDVTGDKLNIPGLLQNEIKVTEPHAAK